MECFIQFQKMKETMEKEKKWKKNKVFAKWRKRNKKCTINDMYKIIGIIVKLKMFSWHFHRCWSWKMSGTSETFILSSYRYQFIIYSMLMNTLQRHKEHSSWTIKYYRINNGKYLKLFANIRIPPRKNTHTRRYIKQLYSICGRLIYHIFARCHVNLETCYIENDIIHNLL